MSKVEFDQRIEQWKNMDRTTRDAQKIALAFYDEHIFPIVKETFINEPENCPHRGYAGLILTVGLSPEPLILSILATKPKRVGFLHTPKTEKVLNRIKRETGLDLSQIDKCEIDGSSIVEMYKAIIELYEKWERPSNIAVDITGGKKSMVSGAAMAGAVLGADIYYVDTNQFNRELSKPEPRSEYLSSLDNPYTVFGDLEIKKAKDLYDRHDYAGAQRIFYQLEQRVGDANKAKTCEAYRLLCAAYESWDNLDFNTAKEEFDQLFGILEQFRTLAGLSHLSQSRLIKQQNALETLMSFAQNAQLALEIPCGFHFAFMLYQNALRREKQGKLDMACLLLYRLLEWVEQHRLALCGINNTLKPDYSKFDTGTLFARYGEKRKEIYGRMDRSALPEPIALVDGFLILHALDDNIVEDLNWRAFLGQVEIRNRSVYAHGMSVINNRSFDAFKSTVERRFKKAQSLI